MSQDKAQDQVVIQIAMSAITASFGNDRTIFDPIEMAELAANIKQNGLVLPIIVRPMSGGGYQLIAGERRYRAHILNEAATISCIVRELSDEQAAIVMLAENTARADIDPIDEANAFARRMRDFGWTLENTAVQAGKRLDYVTRRLALLKLTDTLQFMVRKKQFGVVYAEILANAGLDKTRQLIALRQFNAASAKSNEILTEICSVLASQQAQIGMFDDQLMDAGTQTKQEFVWIAPPLPAKDTPPIATGASPYENGLAQIAFWDSAAEQWDRYNRKTEKALCLMAAAGVRGMLEFLPRHSTKNAQRATKGEQHFIVYAVQ